MSSQGGKKANLAKFHERAIAISQVLFLPAGPVPQNASAVCKPVLSEWKRLRTAMLLHPTHGANRTKTRMVRGLQ